VLAAHLLAQQALAYDAAIDALADEACAQGVPVTTGAYRSMRIVVLHSLGGVPVRARPALAVAR